MREHQQQTLRRWANRELEHLILCALAARGSATIDIIRRHIEIQFDVWPTFPRTQRALQRLRRVGEITCQVDGRRSPYWRMRMART